jgi:hypothetical protein
LELFGVPVAVLVAEAGFGEVAGGEHDVCLRREAYV